jgi:hypothetical protein
MSRNYKITSFTRLESYQKCSNFYKLKYLDKKDIEGQFLPEDSKGSFVHSVLAAMFDPLSKVLDIEDALYLHFSTWLTSLNVDIDIERVWEFANDFGDLCWRATPKCNDPDLNIRTKNGSIPSNLQTYPSRSWTSALKKSGLTKSKFELDNLAASCNPIFLRTSFSFLIGEAFSLLKEFSLPDWIDYVVLVEKGFSTSDLDKLKMPGSDDLYFNGYIDAVIRTKEDELYIVDHKTNKEKPSQQEVQNLPQLNMYAWGYKMTYGEWPTHLVVHHVYSGEYIVAKLDLAVVKQTVAYYSSIQKEGIESNVFVKKHPTSYNSPCLRKSSLTNEVVYECEYLSHCWPEYYQSFKNDSISTHSSIYK